MIASGLLFVLFGVGIAEAANPMAEMGRLHNVAAECVLDNGATGSLAEMYEAIVEQCGLAPGYTVAELEAIRLPDPGLTLRAVVEARAPRLTEAQAATLDALDALRRTPYRSEAEVFAALASIEATAGLGETDRVDLAILGGLSIASSSGQLWIDRGEAQAGIAPWVDLVLTDVAAGIDVYLATGNLTSAFTGGAAASVARAVYY